VPEHIHVSAHEILLRPDKTPFYLDKALKFLRKIGFESHDVERLFSPRIVTISSGNDYVAEHKHECLLEVLAVKTLLQAIRPKDPISWLQEYNEQIKCSPINILPCCGLPAFIVVKCLLNDELKSAMVTEQNIHRHYTR
jgi:hypothetical protein